MLRLHLFALVAAFCFAESTLTFAAATFNKTSYPTGNNPYAAASADIDRNGFPDLIVSDNGNAPYVTVLLGNSSGAFTIGQNIALEEPAIRLVMGDFNGDGYPDVAVLQSDSFQLLFSDHSGGLIPQARHSIPSTGVDMVAIQLNENGSHIPDLAITRCATTCSLELWVNNGTGSTFQETQAITLNHTFRYSLVAADFDRDGHDDIAVTTPTSVETFHNNNNGTLSLLQTIPSPLGTDLYALAAGDIDARNGADLVFAASQPCSPNDCIEPPTLYVYLNDGSGHLVQKQSFAADTATLTEIKLVDLTGDNRLDLVAMNQEIQDSSGSLSWAHYAVGGTFGSFATIAVMAEPRDLVARDFNLDSRHDLAVPDNGGPFGGPSGIPPGTFVFLNTTAGAAYCKAPSSANLAAKFCSPTSTPTAPNFLVTGVSNSPTGVRRMELWVDGKKVYNSPDDRLEYNVTTTTGSHTLTLVAVDQFGQTAKTSKSFTIP